jgi:[ribosomal protein S5]-alanine N-acetyltransferase
MPGDILLETERLWLREYISEDAEAVFELGSNPLVQRYTGDACFTSVEQARKMLCERPIADYRQYGFGRWAVVLKINSKVVGMAGLKFLPERQEVDLGYRLLPEYWGMGLATEASRGCLRYGLDTLRLARIIGLVHPANVQSVRVLEKCGMTFEKLVEIGSQPAAQYAIHAKNEETRMKNGSD